MFLNYSMNNFLIPVVSILSLCSISNASLTINFDFDTTATGDMVLSSENQALFTDAAAFWTDALTGYTDGVSRTLTITASGFDQAPIGGGILLGSAGPTLASSFTSNGTTFIHSTEGSARFNTNAAATGGTGLLAPIVLRHEIGHVLGFGTLWQLNNLYVDGSGQYFGANALEAYRNEFDPNALFVPIELDGGPGTANGHLNEVLDNFSIENMPGFDGDPGDGSAALTVLSGPNAGESLDDEILSGVESGSGFLSDTTLGAFRDLGFTTIDFQATPISVPEPSTLAFSFIGLSFFVLRRKRS